jgi:uncharacterized protein
MSIRDFKPIGIEDKSVFDGFFREDPPFISEMTFTNLFMWRHRYQPLWREAEGCLLVLFQPQTGRLYGLPPVGQGNKESALAILCAEIGHIYEEIRICRVPENFVKAHVDSSLYTCLPDRDNSDYVYLTHDLVHLSGNKYHRKKNHFHQFMKKYDYEYRALDINLVECVLGMQETWCQMRECTSDPGLLAEDYAVREALMRFEDLDYAGGVILMNSRVEAFSMGEALNPDTAVIHVEKANPSIVGLYTAMNQLFCKEAWSAFPYINREQDMGVEGLRKAKESYYPHHMVNKYTVMLKR